MIIAIRDTTYSTKVIVSSLVPLIIVVIFNRAFTAATDQSSANNIKINMRDIFLIIFIASSELSLISYVSTGCIFKVTEHENRILHFLYASKGSKIAHKLANFTYDLIELTILTLITMLGSKMIVFGEVMLSFDEAMISIVVILHSFARVLLVGYPLTNLFNTKKNMLSYYSLFTMALISVLLVGTAYSFVNHNRADFNRKKIVLTLLNYLNVTKVSGNCALFLAPERLVFLNKYKDEVEYLFGGLYFNLCLLFAHIIIYFGMILILDSLKYKVGIKKKQKVNRVHNLPPALLRPAEIAEETEYVKSQMPQLAVYHCEKTYNKKFTAVDDVSFGVEQGKLFTLLGPNGAGKTSVLDIICGISHRTGGSVFLDNGEKIESNNLKHVGFCLQKNYLWEYLTFEEHVRIIAGWRGIDYETTTALIDQINKGLELGKNLRIKAIHLSGGNKRKLNTVLALLSAPRTFILDEPTAGMDPTSRR